jgi:hypothetical protein
MDLLKLFFQTNPHARGQQATGAVGSTTVTIT